MAQGFLGQKTASFKSSLANALDNYVKNSNFLNGNVTNGLAQINNPKWIDFDETGIRRKQALVNNSVSHGMAQTEFGGAFPSLLGGKYNPFSNVLYATLDATKANRLYEYRLMSMYPEVDDAIEEICNSFITLNEFKRPAVFRYEDNEISLDIQKELQDEFNYFLNAFNFKKNGHDYCKEFLINGELFLELIINNKTPENKKKGVLGVMYLPPELTDVYYKDKQNNIIGAFIGKKVTFDPSQPNHIIKMEHIPYHPNQLFYISSNTFDPSGEWIVPFIERARKRYIQLSYLEDAIIIYRLVRAPERLVFDVDVGNMSTAQAESYMTDLRNGYWNAKTFDLNTGDITQKFNPQSMLDSFWISHGTGNEGIKVNQLNGGQNLGQLDDLNYFIKALYRALRIPSSRLNSEATKAIDGSQILQEELKFAEMIVSIQKIFAEGLKQAFISHLKFQEKYQKYHLRENLMDVEFIPPSNYFELRNLQGLKVKAEAFTQLAGNDCLSKSLLLKQVMGFDTNQVLQHYQMRKLEAAKEWEIEQIRAAGPNWQQVQLMQNATGGEGGGDMGGGDMGLGGGSPLDMGGGMPDMGGGEEPADMGPPEGGEAESAAAENPVP